MKGYTVIVIWLGLLAGCALPLKSHQPAAMVLGRDPGEKVLRFGVTRRQSPVVSGLLGVRLQGGGLFFVILDATGIKFGQGEVDAQGNYLRRNGDGVLQDSVLIPFVATALSRIFLLVPEKTPCSTNGLLRFCRQAEQHIFDQWAAIGPFTLWRAEGERNKADGRSVWSYRENLSGMKIVVEEINNDDLP